MEFSEIRSLFSHWLEWRGLERRWGSSPWRSGKKTGKVSGQGKETFHGGNSQICSSCSKRSRIRKLALPRGEKKDGAMEGSHSKEAFFEL